LQATQAVEQSFVELGNEIVRQINGFEIGQAFEKVAVIECCNSIIV